MRHLGTKRLKLAKLKIPKDHSIDDEHVKVLAADMKTRGQLSPIGATRKSVILWGHHRVAGLKLNGETFARAEIWECANPADAEAASIVEQIKRRKLSSGDEAKQMARLVAILNGGDPAPGAGSIAETPAKGGRRPSTRVAAKETGKSERTVSELTAIGDAFSDAELAVLDAVGVKHKARLALAAEVKDAQPLARASAIRDVVKQAMPAKTANGGGVLDKEGRPVAPEMAEVFTVDAKRWAKIDGLLTQAVTELGALSLDLGETKLATAVDRTREVIRGGSHALRLSAPHSTCPYCKRIPTKLPGCGVCEGRGWLGKDSYERAPDLLRQDEKPGVFVGDKFTPLSEIGS